jgi:hypothetical protein
VEGNYDRSILQNGDQNQGFWRAVGLGAGSADFLRPDYQPGAEVTVCRYEVQNRRDEMKDSQIPSMSAAVRDVIDSYPDGYMFHGNELHDDVARVYPEATHQYVDTVLRMMRRHRRDNVVVVDQNNSLYKKVDAYDHATGQRFLFAGSP